EVRSPFGFQLAQLLAMDFAYPRRRYGLGNVNFLHAEAGFVLIEMLAGQPGTLIVGPDESLPAVNMIQPVGMLNVVTDLSQVSAAGQLMKRDLVADSPVGH